MSGPFHFSLSLFWLWSFAAVPWPKSKAPREASNLTSRRGRNAHHNLQGEHPGLDVVKLSIKSNGKLLMIGAELRNR